MKVASKFGVGGSTVWRWYNKLKWKKKEDGRNQEILKKLERKNIGNIVDFKSKALELTDSLIENYLLRIKHVTVKTTRDLDTIIKLHLLLLEQPTEINQNIGPSNREERLERLKKIEEMYKK